MRKNTLDLLSLATIFLKIGSTSYGGWSTTALLIKKELVEKRKIMTEEEVGRALAYSQVLPGSTAVGVVSHLGYRLHKWPGSIVATVCYLLPAVVLMTGLAYLYFGNIISPTVKEEMKGAYAALVGIILANALNLGRQYNKKLVMWIIPITVIVAKVGFGVNSAFIVLAAGIFGVLVFYHPSYD